MQKWLNIRQINHCISPYQQSKDKNSQISIDKTEKIRHLTKLKIHSLSTPQWINKLGKFLKLKKKTCLIPYIMVRENGCFASKM